MTIRMKTKDRMFEVKKGQRVRLEMKKLEEAVHYICSKASDNLGSVKLNKILYYADMLHFATIGSAITGATYAKQEQGPVPKQVVPAIEHLVQAGRLSVQNVSYFDFVKRDFTAHGDTDLSVFSNEEIALLDEMITKLDHFSARGISDLSHTNVWKSADLGETLPYDSFFVSYRGLITDEDMTRVQTSIAEVERENGCAYG